MMRTGRGVQSLLMTTALVAYGLLIDPETGDGGLPCLWQALSGIDCPGCGLSRACALVLRERVHEALALNWLVAPTAILAAWMCVVDVRRVAARRASPAERT